MIKGKRWEPPVEKSNQNNDVEKSASTDAV